ncbi:MAG: sortase [Chloroflexota bacterium]|nr:MAG: sortase [Chloroflexota bacterium]
MSRGSRAPRDPRRSVGRLIAVALLVLALDVVVLLYGGSFPGWIASAWSMASAAKTSGGIPSFAATPTAVATPTATSVPATSPTPIVRRTTPPVGKPGIPARSLTIPSLGIASDVAEVSTTYDAQGNLVWQTVPFLVGHFSGSSNPGQLGNAIFSGHLTSPNAGSVFKRLPDIELGAGIILTSGDTTYLYRVADKKVVEPSDLGPLQDSGKAIVTLITCVPDGVYSHRLVVTGELVTLPTLSNPRQ